MLCEATLLVWCYLSLQKIPLCSWALHWSRSKHRKRRKGFVPWLWAGYIIASHFHRAGQFASLSSRSQTATICPTALPWGEGIVPLLWDSCYDPREPSGWEGDLFSPKTGEDTKISEESSSSDVLPLQPEQGRCRSGVRLPSCLLSAFTQVNWGNSKWGQQKHGTCRLCGSWCRFGMVWGPTSCWLLGLFCCPLVPRAGSALCCQWFPPAPTDPWAEGECGFHTVSCSLLLYFL